MRFLLCLTMLLMSEIGLSLPSTVCALSGASSESTANSAAALMSVPTPAFLVYEQDQYPKFISPAAAYAKVLGTDEKSIVLNNIEELRFLPQTLAHSSILLILADQPDWSAEKSSKVLAVSKLLDIKVTFLWLGSEASPKAVRELAESSGGRSFTRGDVLERLEASCKDAIASR